MPKRIVLLLVVLTWFATAPMARAADAASEAGHSAHETAKSAANVPNETTAAMEHGQGHGEHAKAPLIPDFPPSRETQLQALWVVLIFLILLAILYPTAWKQILAGLKAREQRIRKDIADAEAARLRAETTLKEYNAQLAEAEGKVRDMITKAAGEGERIATTIRMQAQQEAEEIKERATRDIEAARKAAMAEFREYAATVATAAAAQILRRNLNADDQRDLVNRSLDQLETVKT